MVPDGAEIYLGEHIELLPQSLHSGLQMLHPGRCGNVPGAEMSAYPCRLGCASAHSLADLFGGAVAGDSPNDRRQTVDLAATVAQPTQKLAGGGLANS